jgi:diadenosine tetraphosphate (Ap4A) HIT family hydrolase
MTALFRLDPRLAADTAVVTDWPLCRVLVMNDSRYPWLILVPRRANMIEIFDLEQGDRAELIDEIAKASARLKTWAHADKINVGALGNVVPQLHIHIVARKRDDPAGAAPIWGVGDPIKYADQDLTRVVSELTAAFK